MDPSNNLPRLNIDTTGKVTIEGTQLKSDISRLASGTGTLTNPQVI